MQAFNIRICLFCIRYRGRYQSFLLRCKYMSISYSISYPIPKKKLRYRWSKRVRLETPPNIVPDVLPVIEVFDFDIWVGKEGRIGASSEYRNLYRCFLLRYQPVPKAYRKCCVKSQKPHRFGQVFSPSTSNASETKNFKRSNFGQFFFLSAERALLQNWLSNH
jgi:hypothetical protein